MFSLGFTVQLLCACVLWYAASDLQRRSEFLRAFVLTHFEPMVHLYHNSCDVIAQYYVDGGFTRMQPVAPVPHSQTLTVCPFSGEIDICPSDTPSMWDMVVSGCTLKANKANGIKIVNALYPMDLEVRVLRTEKWVVFYNNLDTFQDMRFIFFPSGDDMVCFFAS